MAHGFHQEDDVQQYPVTATVVGRNEQTGPPQRRHLKAREIVRKAAGIEV